MRKNVRPLTLCRVLFEKVRRCSLVPLVPGIARGGSRIPHRRGRQLSGGAPTYDFAKFCEKLHEIEKILGRRGVRAGGAP